MKNTLKKTILKSVKKLTTTQKKDLETLHDLFLVQLKDLYDTEKQIKKALPKIIKTATHGNIKLSLTSHLKETEGQIERLEHVYEYLDMRAQGKTSLGMKGLLDDGKEVMSMKAKPELIDAAIVANAQHVEHHEIAGYKATIEWAKLLEMKEVVSLLEKNLKEEETMAHKLTTLATDKVNKKAAELR